MNCRDFSEIADSYLSNELLVETNHEVIRHLEDCRNCRELLAERRELRARLKRAIADARESHVDTAFAAKLRESLRSGVEKPKPLFAGFRVAFTVLAVVLAAFVGAIFLLKDPARSETAVNRTQAVPANTVVDPPRIVPAMLAEISLDAFDDHKNCALAHKLKELPISLEKAARTVDAVNLDFDKSVIAALSEKFGPDVVLVKAHYCMINGRYFTHVIVKLRKRTMSVLMTKLPGNVEFGAAACGSDGDLSSACFSASGYGVYLISDSGESDMLVAANIISGAVASHISRTRISV